MLWVIQFATSLLYSCLLDFVFFVVVDAFAKLTIGDAATKSRQEKKVIWFWESVVLAGLSLLIYFCDHVPYLLIGLTVMTFVYTQLDGTFNLYHWWMVLKTRWEEWQQHQDSMIRMQEQITRQKQQQEINEVQRLNFVRRQPMDFTMQQTAVPTPSVNTQQANVNLPSPQLYHLGKEEKNTSVWSRFPRMRLSSVFRKAENESFSANQPSSVQPPKLRQEYSFMPESGYKKLGTNLENSPPKKPFWSGENLLRRPLRSQSQKIAYPSSPGVDSFSFRSRVMSVFGMSSNGDVPSGLRNEGQNLCFMNSIIQCLARTPGLVSELTTENLKESDSSMAESAFLCSIVELLTECSKRAPAVNVLDPTAFRQAASELHSVLVAPPSQRQMQQDSSEFFLWLLDTMHTIISKNKKDNPSTNNKKESPRMEVLKFIYGDLNPAKVEDLKRACQQEIDAAHGLMNDSYAEPVQRLSDLEWMSYKAGNNSVIDNTFTGQLVIAYHCLTDNHISVNMQTFNILPVPIVSPREVNGLVNLSDCFDKFCNIEHLVGQDGLECSICNGSRSRPYQPSGNVNKLSTNAYPFTSGTPKTNGRQTMLSSADSAISGMNSPLPSNLMSPIPGNIDVFSDSGFHDHVFKTSTPISEMSNHTARPQRLHDAQRRCLLRQLPDCLVIQLMRFSYNVFTRQTGKVTAPVRIPLKSLDLTQIMFDTITQREDLSDKEVSYTYDLYGVCCHLGAESTNCGHYINYALQDDDKWFKFDDETVTEVNMEYELTRNEVRRNAYILFFKKTKKSKK